MKADGCDLRVPLPPLFDSASLHPLDEPKMCTIGSRLRMRDVHDDAGLDLGARERRARSCDVGTRHGDHNGEGWSQMMARSWMRRARYGGGAQHAEQAKTRSEHTPSPHRGFPPWRSAPAQPERARICLLTGDVAGCGASRQFLGRQDNFSRIREEFRQGGEVRRVYRKKSRTSEKNTSAATREQIWMEKFKISKLVFIQSISLET
ncbi:hypothetical protein DFH09DRAFT_1289703 [Mycena vulgaris]|nr:hypothetical protein DFH09DRAFT_1289703 [Mycena vulgaris]